MLSCKPVFWAPWMWNTMGLFYNPLIWKEDFLQKLNQFLQAEIIQQILKLYYFNYINQVLLLYIYTIFIAGKARNDLGAEGFNSTWMSVCFTVQLECLQNALEALA